jgi:hypothetical protein
MSLPIRRPGRALTLLRARARANENTSAPLWPARLAGDLPAIELSAPHDGILAAIE